MHSILNIKKTRKMKNLIYTLWAVIIGFCCFTNANAQDKLPDLDSVVHAYLTKNLDLDKFKDSASVYTFAIKINITQPDKRHITIDSISTNNPLISKLMFKDLSGLKQFNYKNYIGNYKKVKIIIPILVVVGAKNYNSVSISEIFDNSAKLFYINKSVPLLDFYHKKIILNPMTLVFDLAIYN